MTFPTHQVRHICKAHKGDTQNQTLQKSLPCSNASGTHPTSLDTYFQFDKPERRATYNKGIAKMQADGSRVSTTVSLLGCISSLTLSILLCAYHHLFYLYSAAVSRADGILFPALRQYLAVVRYQNSALS